MKCLNCDAELDLDNPTDDDLVVCGCGIDYSTLFLESARPEVWEELRASKKFMRNGRSIMLFNNRLFD